MHLMVSPAEPRTNPLLTVKLSNPKYACWKSFLTTSAAVVEIA
jgi:hypothetical protein